MRLAEELAQMREHLAPELPDYTETMVRVNNNSSTIRVCKRVYSVPSKLIGSRLRARIHETSIVLAGGVGGFGRAALRGGDRGAVIDFRHIITGWCESRVRSPNTDGEKPCSLRWSGEWFTTISAGSTTCVPPMFAI